MYKGKTFDLWYDRINDESVLNVIFIYNKMSITLNLDEFMKFKKEISGLNDKFFNKRSSVTIIKSERGNMINVSFIKNNVELKLPLTEFKHFKNEISGIKDDFIKDYIENEGYDYLDNVNEIVEIIDPKKTFDEIILNEKTKRQIELALAQIKNHDLIFNKWGLGKKHDYGTAISLNFVGMPGTGKTLAAEVIAKSLRRKLYVVQYSNLVDSYIGETGKNIKLVFDYAEENSAVLFFDEADAIISARTNVFDSTDSLINMDKSILLKRLEKFNGVVIFSTNLASNIDKAFERRISTHVYFDMPKIDEREKIFMILIGEKMPVANDVNFRELAERYTFSGGDIKNVILNAARLASSENIKDDEKTVRMKHFIEAAELVKKGKEFMNMSVLDFDRNDVRKSTNYIG